MGQKRYTFFFFLAEFEEWKDIDGYDGIYQISSNGVVRNITKCYTMQPRQNRRLHYVTLSKDSERKQFCIEHLLQTYFPEIYPSNKEKVIDLPGEIWKDIKGFEGKYQCSNKGRIKTLDRDYWTGRDFTCLRHIDEKTLKPTVSERGYLRVDLRVGSAKKHCLKWVHNIVARTFYDNYDLTLVPNHIDGIKTNNCIENLELVTTKENVQHAIRTGLRRNKGEDSGRATITNCQAKTIRELFIRGMSRSEIAKDMNISLTVVQNVIKNKSYIDENYQYKEGKGFFANGA